MCIQFSTPEQGEQNLQLTACENVRCKYLATPAIPAPCVINRELTLTNVDH